jgi:serine/threonine-protein kinase
MYARTQSNPAPVPTTLFDYEVIDLIGQGAGSLIYAVSDPRTRQLYALKHVVRNNDRDVRFIEQLEAESQIGRKVVHPNLRRSIEFKVNRNFLMKITEAVLLMELFDGQPLEWSLPGDLGQVLDVFIQTAHGLAALHQAGFVHCDLKPNNILVGPSGEVKVIDLGQACPMNTVKTRIQGTPDYIAPEQVKLAPVTHRTDIFNFGATLYWALCGRKLPTLFTLRKGDNSFLVDDHLDAPRTINPGLPERLSDLTMECVRTNPRKRPADMHEIIQRLEVIQHAVRKAQAIPA